LNKEGEELLKRALLVLAVVVSVVVVAGESNQASARVAASGRSIVKLPWQRSTGRVVSGRYVPVSGRYDLLVNVESGYCYGFPKPYIDHLKVVEKPRSQIYPSPSVVITAYVVQAPEPAPDEPLCGGINITLGKLVVLKRPVEGLFLYDGSLDPPRQVQRPTLVRPASLP
jgi:hypothetical protein